MCACNFIQHWHETDVEPSPKRHNTARATAIVDKRQALNTSNMGIGLCSVCRQHSSMRSFSFSEQLLSHKLYVFVLVGVFSLSVLLLVCYYSITIYTRVLNVVAFTPSSSSSSFVLNFVVVRVLIFSLFRLLFLYHSFFCL